MLPRRGDSSTEGLTERAAVFEPFRPRARAASPSVVAAATSGLFRFILDSIAGPFRVASRSEDKHTLHLRPSSSARVSPRTQEGCRNRASSVQVALAQRLQKRADSGISRLHDMSQRPISAETRTGAFLAERYRAV